MYILAEKKVTVQTIMGWFLFDIIFPPYSLKVEVGFKFNVIAIIKTKTWLIYHGVKEYTKQNKTALKSKHSPKKNRVWTFSLLL